MEPAPTWKRASPWRSWRLPALRALAWSAFSGCIATLCAADSGTLLQVSANVSPVARLESTAPAPVLITSADVARGYVEVPHPLHLHVYSNSRTGFALDVAARSPWFTAVAIDGLDTQVTLGAEGGTIVQRWQGTPARALELRMRFRLEPGLPPGLYAWPLLLRARPLQP